MHIMGLIHQACLNLLVVALLVVLAAAIPTSLVDEIKSSELRNNKDLDWEQEQADFINRNTLPNISSSLFKYPDNNFGDDKTIAEYEKGFRYGTNKDRLDEALENAVLKYFGADAAKKRKRRDAKKLRLDSRIKREVDLTPEEILALLSLYENGRPSQRRPQSENYRYPWNRFEANADQEQAEPQDQEENWLDDPVYPHASGYDRVLGPKYAYEGMQAPQQALDGGWRGLEGGDSSRRVAQKRNVDPTRELRYLNGPNKNDFYTLSHLLSNQKEPNLPVYHRLLL
ncbi:unnamed protein product [Phaedon cochleariae]|uniref:Uncharacterized protein n=1 Tax=Phaedon cochleariae TaxID=80249 RepID=A0A9N9S884_PHACE|nr:unnamed protein product [Phaedon cochleariae]